MAFLIPAPTTTPFGPSGEVVYKRTYARPLPDGTLETWPETVRRVVRGNLSLVYGDDEGWSPEVCAEHDRLVELMEVFKIIPAGRHLWASGVKGRQYLSNCFVAGWGEDLSEHFSFTFLRLMEGGGVGANYSSHHLAEFRTQPRRLNVHVVCDPSHPDYAAMEEAGVLSGTYSSDWHGAFTVEDSREGWAAALTDLIDTYVTRDHVEHENRVYDVTNVRARGSRLKTFGGTASGPLPFARLLHSTSAVFNGNADADGHSDIYGHRQLTPLEAMEVDHAIGECVVSGGVRRSARMSIVRWDDPFIFHFLDAKADVSKHWTTNISVEIDNAFLDAYAAGDYHAHLVMESVAIGMLTNGEPGLWNSSLSNVGEVGRVVATNPCGEIGLEEWENCNLGHINLDAFAQDLDGLPEAHRLMTRFLMRATFSDVNDAKQAERMAANRRIGVGHLGVQGFLVKQGVRYSEAPDYELFSYLLKDLYKVVRDEARRYAFELRIPEPVKVTTVAPTGTIAKMPGVTEGIHPIYSRFFIRRIRFNITDPEQAATVEQARRDGFLVEPDRMDSSGNTMVVAYPTKDSLVAEVEALGYPASLVESQDELTVEQLLAFQKLYQRDWADNAVSFTINKPAAPHQQEAMLQGLPVPPPAIEDVRKLSAALVAALPELKGTTVMLDGSRPQSPYERIDKDTYEQFANRVVADGVDDECATGACPVR